MSKLVEPLRINSGISLLVFHFKEDYEYMVVKQFLLDFELNIGLSRIIFQDKVFFSSVNLHAI